MKQAQRLWEIMKVALFVAAVLFIASQALASEPTKAPASEEHTADIKAALTMHLVTLPDAPSFKAQGKGVLIYRIEKSSAILKAESIPAMVFESPEPVGEYAKLTVIATGIRGTEPVIDWANYPTVTIKPLDLRIRAFAAAAAQVTDSTKPITDIVLENLSFSTDKIEVEGVTAQGYIDVEGPAAQVVGEAVLPDDPLPQYTEELAGAPALLELYVTLPNPYKK